MSIKAVMTIGRLVVSALDRYKHTSMPEYLKQGVSPHCQPQFAHRSLQYFMQLARAQSRLLDTHLLNQVDHLLRFFRIGTLSAASLIIRLPAQAHVAASPRDSQPFDEVLLKDLPEGFFTTRTP